MPLLPLSLLSLLSACTGGPPPDDRPNLVLIVMDTTRADRLSVYGHEADTSPQLAALAAQGTRFERAWSVSSWTLPSHASLLTGQPPDIHGADQEHYKIRPEVPTLAEQLSASGYQTAGFSNNPWVGKRSHLSRGFAVFEDMWRGREDRRSWWKTHGAHPTVAAARAWQREVGEEQPYFAFINLIEPHLPYRPPEADGEPFFPSEEAFVRARDSFPKANRLMARHYRGEKPLSDNEWDDLRALYDGELHRVDTVAAELARVLTGKRRETLVIITADHGEHISEHGLMGHVFSLHEEVVRVPLLLVGAGVAAGATRDEPASLLDVYTTLAAAAGLEVASPGLDLRQPLPAEGERTLTLSYAWPRLAIDSLPQHVTSAEAMQPYLRALRGAVDGRWKVIRGSDGVEWWYDLSRDPHELHPLALEEVPEAVVARLRAAAGEPRGKSEDDGEQGYDPETEAELRSLGYLD